MPFIASQFIKRVKAMYILLSHTRQPARAHTHTHTHTPHKHVVRTPLNK